MAELDLSPARTHTADPGARRRLRAAATLLLGGTVLVAIAMTIWRLCRGRRSPQPPGAGDPESLRGLSAAEAAGRLPDIDLKAIESAARRTFILRAVRANLLTVFNLDMFAITALMFLLGSPLSGLGTMGVLIANVVVHVGQEVLARSRLERMIAAIRPRVTVIREAAPQLVDAREIVTGDLVAIGLGDEIAVPGVLVGQGQIRVASIAAIASGGSQVRRGGDRVEAGDYCVEGHSLMWAAEQGAHREALQATRAEVLAQTYTPLEILMRRVLFALLAVVVIFSLALLTGKYIPMETPESQAVYRNAFSLVFGVAPTSLFLLVVLSYVMGLIEVARRSGLVYRPATIEALAGTNTVCLTGRSVMSGAHIRLEPIEPAAVKALPLDITRRLLADLIHSLPAYTAAWELIAAALPGNRRRPADVAGHLSAFGWQGASFDEPDMRGTFVVGVAQTMAAALSVPEPKAPLIEEASARVEESKIAARRGVAWVGHVLAQLGRRAPVPAAAPVVEVVSPPAGEAQAEIAVALDGSSERSPERPSLRSRLRSGLQRALAPRDLDPSRDGPGLEAEARSLVFAYRPDPVPLTDAEGNPVLPTGLIPLALVKVSESVSPAALYSIGSLQSAGLSVVLLTGSDPDSVAHLAGSLGVDRTVNLAGLTPAQTAAAIASLRMDGGAVAEVAQGLGEVPSMLEADVGFALRGASPAVLAQADVVLVEGSLAALPGILSLGRRVVNGVMAMLELNLSHIATQLGLLAITFAFVFNRFPYTPVQSGTISAFSITIPSVLLLVFAPSRSPGVRAAGRRLIRFVAPSGVATIVLVLGVFAAFQAAGTSVAIAQLAVTWALTAAGLLRVLMALPPTRLWAGAEALVGDFRVLPLVGGSAALLLICTAIPLTQRLLGLGWLPSASDYAVLAGALVVWVACQLGFWRWIWRGPPSVPTPATMPAAQEPTIAWP
jgi:soluble P-type ATPase